MAKSYKKKHEQEEVITKSDTLSKKEQYDLEKQKRLALKEKEQKKKKNTSKKKTLNKVKETNIGARIFAIFMLVLMVGSVVVSVLSYVVR